MYRPGQMDNSGMGAMTVSKENRNLVLTATDADFAQLLPGEAAYLRRRFVEGSTRVQLARVYDVRVSNLEHLEKRAIRKLGAILSNRENLR